MFELFSTLFGLLFLTFIGGLIYLIYEDSQSPTFSLKKDEWVCAASHLENQFISQPVGKTVIVIPTTITVCDQYNRK